LVGAGATFRIYLPRIAAAETAGAQPPVRERFHGHETVLLVEDDDSLRELTRKILGGLGYNVLIASHAAQAEEVCARFDGKIHLLLSDVIMPGATGGELVSRLLPLRSEMKAILMSGYADRGLEPGVAALGDHLHFLQKPFSPQILAAKLREVLDAAPAPI